MPDQSEQSLENKHQGILKNIKNLLKPRMKITIMFIHQKTQKEEYSELSDFDLSSNKD